MKDTTIKTIMDVDYVVYFDTNMKLVGYKMSEDDGNAFQLRYHTADNCGIEDAIPEKAFYFLEIFGVPTTLAFTLKEEGEKGELLIYHPSPMALTKAIGETIETVSPLDGKSKKEDETKPTTMLVPTDEDRLRDILNRIPYPNWMEECWGTPAWIKIWSTKPCLQSAMLEFSTAKYRRKGRKKEHCLYLKKGVCVINKGVSCTFETCTEFEVR